MKALVLWQPWATLVAAGAKRIETRSWSAPVAVVGQRIAIQAAKTDEHLYRYYYEPFESALVHAGYVASDQLPLGAVVCTARLVECVPITPALFRNLDRSERAFGVYAEGRFAWRLEDVRRCRPPIPMKGRQRIFNVPPDVEARLP